MESKHLPFRGVLSTNQIFRSSRPIVDSDKRVIGILGGEPRDPNWKNEVTTPLTEAFREGAKAALFTSDQKNHRRGNFAALASGISYGGGQRVSRILPPKRV